MRASDRLRSLDGKQSRPLWGLVTLLAMLMLAACSEGGGDGGAGTSGSYVWVVIDTPAADATVSTASATFSGQASCPDCPPSETAFGYCPAVAGFVPGGVVTVDWLNHSSGAVGTANQGITGSCSCFLSYCTVSYRRAWSAMIPLQAGVNAIEVKAAEGSAATASESRTITRVPPPPAGVVATAAHGAITLGWQAVPEATSYNVYWSTSRDLSVTSGSKLSTATTSYQHSGLTDGVTYFYLVTAVNGAYEGFPSTVVLATAGWTVQEVAATLPSTVQRDLAIAADSAGYAHLHYSYDEKIGYASLQHNYYTTNASGSFVPQFVANPLEINARLALASDNTVHVSYLDFAGVTHAVYNSGIWSAEVVDAQGVCDDALAVDGAGHLHMAYRAASAAGDKLRYATNASGGWVTSDVASYASTGCSQSGRAISIAVDSSGVVHITYNNGSPDYGLRYASNGGGSWAVSVVSPDHILQNSLAVDQAGKAHVVFTNNANQLWYATNAAGAWSVAAVDGSVLPVMPSLVLDGSDNAHISYFDNYYSELHYARNNSGTWQTSVIAAAGAVATYYGTNTAIAVDGSGGIHIGYFDNNTGNLNYATNR